MSKILVVSDDDSASVEVMPFPDPTAPDDDDQLPFFIAQCRTPGCTWNSFIDENTTHLRESDAINDAEIHIDQHEHAEA